MICTTVPTLLSAFARELVFVAMAIFLSLRERFGAGSDLQHFLGDARLPRLVRGERELADEVASGVGRVAHRDHLRGELRGLRFEDRLIDRDLHEPRKDRVEHGLGIWLEEVLERRALVDVL